MRNEQASDFTRESEQWDNSFAAIHAAIGFFIVVLLALLQVKYQNSTVSPFKAHGALILLFTLAVFVYTIAWLGVITLARNSQRQTETSYYLPTLKHISLISGAIACGSLLSILVPPIGYVVFALSALLFVRILLGSYQEFYQLLRHAAIFTFNTVVRESIQMVFQLLDRAMHQVATAVANAHNSIERPGSQAGISSQVTLGVLPVATDSMV